MNALNRRLEEFGVAKQGSRAINYRMGRLQRLRAAQAAGVRLASF